MVYSGQVCAAPPSTICSAYAGIAATIKIFAIAGQHDYACASPSNPFLAKSQSGNVIYSGLAVPKKRSQPTLSRGKEGDRAIETTQFTIFEAVSIPSGAYVYVDYPNGDRVSGQIQSSYSGNAALTTINVDTAKTAPISFEALP